MAGKGKGIQPTGKAPGKRPRRNGKRGTATSSAVTSPSSGVTASAGTSPTRSPRAQVIPDAVANRMARRIGIATGIPTLMGMGVFVASYLLVSRGVLDIPPEATLVASGGFFLLGLLGLSYGVLSASWEPQPGSWFGAEQIGLNISRLKDSIRSMRQRRVD
ncbi:MAG: photosystem II biosynthesis protein [Prochlorococcaceae cyanobacterium]